MTHRQRACLAGLLAVIAAAVGYELPASSSPTPPSRIDAPRKQTPDGKLDPDLQRALRRAAADASQYGVELHVDSGRRSPEHQARLLREAIAKYGSAEEAARWVATPEKSAHVSGDAVDMAPAGAAWLAEHGAAHGLCRIYANEPWHYELRSTEHGCPPRYADATQDPRMQ